MNDMTEDKFCVIVDNNGKFEASSELELEYGVSTQEIDEWIENQPRYQSTYDSKQNISGQENKEQ